jgi:hypothetical protein
MAQRTVWASGPLSMIAMRLVAATNRSGTGIEASTADSPDQREVSLRTAQHGRN